MKRQGTRHSTRCSRAAGRGPKRKGAIVPPFDPAVARRLPSVCRRGARPYQPPGDGLRCFGGLSGRCEIIGTGRTPLSGKEFRARMRKGAAVAQGRKVGNDPPLAGVRGRRNAAPAAGRLSSKSDS